MFTVFLGLTIPIYITIVPNFITLRSFGLTDSLVGLTGPYLAFGPVLRPGAAVVLPPGARRDHRGGQDRRAGPWRIFFTIVLPLSTPALVTVAILDGVSTWNELLMALIILNSENSKTVPVGLLNFQGQFANNNTGLAAGILIAVVPILIAYILMQTLDRRRADRRRDQGLTLTTSETEHDHE